MRVRLSVAFVTTVLWCAWFCLILCRGFENDEVLKEEWCKEDNCYDLLGVTQSSDFREIKGKYNNISLKLYAPKDDL